MATGVAVGRVVSRRQISELHANVASRGIHSPSTASDDRAGMFVAEASAMTSTQITAISPNALAQVVGGAEPAKTGFPGCGDLDFACQAAKVAQWRDRKWRKMVAHK